MSTVEERLRALAKQSAERHTAPHASAGPLPPLTQSRGRSWRSWAIGIALIFGAYVYLGPLVLKDEYQWRVLVGTAVGKGEAAALSAVTPAEAAKAKAVAEAQVPSAIETAVGAEQAKVRPAIDIAASQAEIAIGQKQVEAQIAVWTASEQAKIEAAKAAQVELAKAFQECIKRAQTLAEGAAGQAANSQYGTLAHQEAARASVLDRYGAECERYRPQQDQALDSAAGAARAAEQRVP
jgi:hypothetical protein